MARLLVVGAGLAGIAAALESCRLGHDVAIVDASNPLGGRGTSIERNGWILDAGPHFLTESGQIREWLKKSSKVPLANRRLNPKEMYIIRAGKMRKLPLSKEAIDAYGVDSTEKRRLLGLSRYLSSELKHNSNLSIEKWIEDKSQAIIDIVECLTIHTSYLHPEHSANLSFHFPKIISALRGKNLYSPLGGWAEVTGRFLAALDQLEVQSRAASAVERLLKDKNGAIRGARLNGNVKVEADGVIMATPLIPTTNILASSRIDVELPAPCELKATVWDILLSQNLFHGTHAIWDADRRICIYVPNYFSPEKIPEELRGGHTYLQILSFNGSEPIIEFLDERCAGWHNHIVDERRLEDVVISQAGEVFEGRPGRFFEQPLLEQGIALAGDWTADEEWLSEAAFISGLKAAKELHEKLNE